MAIPMSWPVTEEHELDALLEHLMVAIRQIEQIRRIRQRRRMQNQQPNRVEPATGPIHQPDLRQLEARGLRVSLHPLRVFYYNREITNVPARESPTTSLPEPETPLPDLLNDIANCRTPKPNETETTPSPSWTQTGADLRHIADAFEDMRTPPEESPRHNGKPKDWNLLLTLCPIIVNTIWPILTFVLGWNMLTRKR